MQKLHVDIIMYLFCLNGNHCGTKKINLKKKKKKIAIVKNNIAICIAGKVSRYIDASMNRATPNGQLCAGDRQADSRVITGRGWQCCSAERKMYRNYNRDLKSIP